MRFRIAQPRRAGILRQEHFAESLMMSLSQIDHVALAVRDPAKTAEWYRSVLGLQRRHQEVWGDWPIMMCAGETCLALFPAKNDNTGEVSPSVAMRHLAFRVDKKNFALAQTELRDRHIPFEFQDHQIAHSIYFRDPDGYQLEITTYDLVPTAASR